MALELIDLIEEFLNDMQKNNGSSTIITYRRKIYVFYEFVKLNINKTNMEYMFFLNTMDKYSLLQSVEYYVKAGNLKSRASVDIYYSVLVNFYNFLLKKFGKTNDYFQENKEKAEFKEAFEEKIKELHLRESEQQEPIDREMAERILKECDKLIDSVDFERIFKKEKGVYSNYVSSLMVKFVLLYGLKNDAIRKLKIDDYNAQLNDMIINNYRVRLPDGLAMQMKKYKGFRDKFCSQYQIKSTRLFFDEFNVEKELDNTKMFIVLKKVMGNMQAQGVAKYAIIQLLREGIPAYIISDFTDYKEDVLSYCQEKVDEERGISLISEKNRILDAALRKNDMFDYL